MVKIVIIGSCRFEPYEILAVPEAHPTLYNTEEGYRLATSRFYPAIDESDFVVLYDPDGVGEHTKRDLGYAFSKNKPVLRFSMSEKFWSWLLMSAKGEPVYWNDATLAEWLESKRREYESLSHKSVASKELRRNES